MQKVIFYLGLLFILFSFIFAGIAACDDGSCAGGDIPCPCNGGCCPEGKRTIGHNNGKCYASFDECLDDPESGECSWCNHADCPDNDPTTGGTISGGSSGGSGGGNSGPPRTCPTGQCLAYVNGYVCCPSTHPWYCHTCDPCVSGQIPSGSRKCFKTEEEITKPNYCRRHYVKCSYFF